MLRQAPPSEWIANGSQVMLCQLPFSADEADGMHAIHFTPMEPQLHHYSHAMVTIDGHVFRLVGARDTLPGSDHWYVSAESRGDVRDPSILVDKVCAAFGISSDALRWTNSDLGPRAWLLWRLDDNGDREQMWYFNDVLIAERTAKVYTDRGHKQFYFVEPCESSRG